MAGLFLAGDTCLKILGMAFTAKQEAFIAAAIKGMNDSDAYRFAYDCSRMKPETVNRKAHELMRNGKIRARIEAARAEAAKRAQWSLDMAVERTKAVNDVAFEDITKHGICEKRPTTKAFIDSASMLNRLTGVDRQITKAEEQSDSRPECPPFDLSANISPTFCSVSRAIDGGKTDRVVLKGGRGSSKSSYAYQKALDVFLKRPHAQWICGRRFANTLRRSCFANTLWAIGMRGMTVGKPGEGCDFDKTVSPMEITYNKTGQKIIFVGLDEPEKLKSITFEDPEAKIEILLLEEYNQLNSAEDARNVRQSVFRSDYSLEFDIFNPDPDEMQWANQEALIAEPGKLVHHSTYLDVPEEFIGKKFIEQAEALKKINPKAHDNEYGGKVTGLEGKVFENIVDFTITDEMIEEFAWIRNGIDWGFSVDPWVFLRIAYDSKRRILYIFGEDFATGLTDPRTVERAKGKLTKTDAEGHRFFKPYAMENLIYADSAEPKSIATYKQLGMNIHAVKKGAGSIKQGIKWLQDRAEIRIDKKRCPLAYQEFTRYTYELDKDKNVTTGLPDEDNHTIDACRYACSPLIMSKKEV